MHLKRGSTYFNRSICHDILISSWFRLRLARKSFSIQIHSAGNTENDLSIRDQRNMQKWKFLLKATPHLSYWGSHRIFTRLWCIYWVLTVHTCQVQSEKVIKMLELLHERRVLKNIYLDMLGHWVLLHRNFFQSTPIHTTHFSAISELAFLDWLVFTDNILLFYQLF